MASGVFRRKSSLCTTPCSGEVGKHFNSINIIQHYINTPHCIEVCNIHTGNCCSCVMCWGPNSGPVLTQGTLITSLTLHMDHCNTLQLHVIIKPSERWRGPPVLPVRAGVPAAAAHAAPVHHAPRPDHQVAAQRAAAARQAHAHAELRAVAGGRALGVRGVVTARAVQRGGGQPAPGGGGRHQVHADQRARGVRPAGRNTILYLIIDTICNGNGTF